MASDEELKQGISFFVDFSLTDGQIEGTITHCRTEKQMKFSGLDQNAIIQFMKGYLFRLEKSIEKMPVEEEPQPSESPAEVQPSAGLRISPTGEMRTRSFGVIPSDAARPTEVLQQGQPFQVHWSFDPPAMADLEGQQLDYRVVIWGKNLDDGQRLMIGDHKAKIGFGSPLTARIPSAPLPPGAYRLEAESIFGLKSAKSEWHSSCRERRLIQVI
jgi:hypothetical protein